MGVMGAGGASQEFGWRVSGSLRSREASADVRRIRKEAEASVLGEAEEGSTNGGGNPQRGWKTQAEEGGRLIFFLIFFYELSLCVRYRCYKQEVS